MSRDEFWSSVYSGVANKQKGGRLSAVRVALLFGMATMAIALIVPPMIQVSSDDWRFLPGSFGIDYTTTATSTRNKEYIIHRSVLQSSTSAVCIIERDGRRTGDC
ncbi:MAG: hypothetical protein AAF724_20585 [Pseudomonadota bacterium]